MQNIIIIKKGKKWILEGINLDWATNRQFQTKWRAEAAADVVSKGGSRTKYFEKVREYINSHPLKPPIHAIRDVRKSLSIIVDLYPSSEEIDEYGESAPRGAVTEARTDVGFGPRLHNTYMQKLNGRVHIDIGSASGTHLMLDRKNAKDFIKFLIKKKDSE